MRKLTISLLLTATLCVSPYGAFSQTREEAHPSTVKRDDPRVSSLPAPLRERGLTLLREADEKGRAGLAADLAAEHPVGAMDFLLAVLERDSSGVVRRVVVDRLGRYSHPKVRQMLERIAAADRDVSLAALALERLRLQHTRDMIGLLEGRLELARRNGDDAATRQLAQEHERWVSLARGVMLPAFLRRVPPLFTLKTPEGKLRILAFGDFGNGSIEQKQVAASMLKMHHLKPFGFAITLGDNFYNTGMESPTDPRWQTWWEDIYTPLGIHFYATLGNHDWGQPDSPAAEILYTQKSQSWRMPAPYYSYTAGPVQFFALDTNEMSVAQLVWLNDELMKSRARWKLVYGHHPIYSAGAHKDSERLIKQLLPVLRDRADVYIAGHDHDMQHLRAEGGVHFFVSGAAGARVRAVRTHPRTLFAKSAYGFSVIEVDEKEMTVQMIGTDLSELYRYTLHK